MGTAIREAWENIRHGLVAAWTALTPENRSFFAGVGIGAASAVGFVWLLF
jgi:hypothetical protein